MNINYVKNNLPFEFNKSIKSILMAKARSEINTLSEGKFNDDNTIYLIELLKSTGFEDIEKDEDELTAITKNLHIARLIADQLDNTRYKYQIEIVSLDDLSGVDEDSVVFDSEEEEEAFEKEEESNEVIISGSGKHDGDGIDFDSYAKTYDENSDDIFVVTVYLDTITEGTNPLKRTTQIGITAGKRVRKLVKAATKGFKITGGKVKRQSSSEKINRKRGSRKAVLAGKGKQAIKVRKFKKSIKKSEKISNRQSRRT